MTHDERFPRHIISDVLWTMTEALAPRSLRPVSVWKLAFVGSYRRGSADCGDADLLVLPVPGHERDIRSAILGLASEIVFDGSSMLYVIIPMNGMSVPAQVFIAGQDAWGSALQYTTGSREHNLAVRKWAKDRGLSANQYGVFRRDVRRSKLPGSSETESGFYRSLGLRWVRPEMRIRRTAGSTGIFPLHPNGNPEPACTQGDGREPQDRPSGASQPAHGSDDVPDRRASR